MAAASVSSRAMSSSAAKCSDRPRIRSSALRRSPSPRAASAIAARRKASRSSSWASAALRLRRFAARAIWLVVAGSCRWNSWSLLMALVSSALKTTIPPFVCCPPRPALPSRLRRSPTLTALALCCGYTMTTVRVGKSTPSRSVDVHTKNRRAPSRVAASTIVRIRWRTSLW